MTLETKRYEILRRVIPQAAPPLDVVSLKIFKLSTQLTTPAVPSENLSTELPIILRFKA